MHDIRPTQRSNQPYVGRFAPSPTGPLHFGSLVAALASYLDARANHGTWRVRIEDLDPPRESQLAPAKILRQLEHFGLKWDFDVLYQSTRLDAYQVAINRLIDEQKLFVCTCSRKSVKGVYKGTCRANRLRHFSDQTADSPPFAIRLETDDITLSFDDKILGPKHYDLSGEVGDFILKRKDGLFAYQLAVVVDDAYQNITHIIRGNDLIDSTPKQQYLTQCLGYQDIQFGHIPLVLGNDGHKLSKQAHAAPVELEDPIITLNQALKALGQAPQSKKSVNALLAEAISNWRIDSIPLWPGVKFSTLSSKDAI